MNERSQARAAGLTYLAYIGFTMTSSILCGKATSTNGACFAWAFTSRVSDGLLDLAQIVCALVLAATLFRLTQTIDKTLSLLAM